MAIFYKYYSYLPLHYFENPTVKIATPANLNDPFESLLPEDMEEYIYQFINENEANFKHHKEDIAKALVNVMRMYGIVSLSETQRNLLMWAHYANEHKGICIGYDVDCLFDEKVKLRLKKDATLRKVNYDSVRHENFGNICNLKKVTDVVHYILYKIMLTKGNDWIYEKEHRFIIDLDGASYVKTNREDINKNPKLKKSINEMLEGNAIEEREIIKEEDEGGVVCFTPKSDKSRKGFGYLNLQKEASYFLNINPKSIKRVYFGCRTSNEYIQKVIGAITKNKSIYNEVKLNRIQLDKNRFELNIDPKEEYTI